MDVYKHPSSFVPYLLCSSLYLIGVKCHLPQRYNDITISPNVPSNVPLLHVTMAQRPPTCSCYELYLVANAFGGPMMSSYSRQNVSCSYCMNIEVVGRHMEDLGAKPTMARDYLLLGYKHVLLISSSISVLLAILCRLLRGSTRLWERLDVNRESRATSKLYFIPSCTGVVKWS